MPLLLLGSPFLASAKEPRVVTVTGFDYAFTAPDTIAAGTTTFRFIDKGAVDHHLIIFRVAPSISLSEFYRLMSGGGPSPSGISSRGGLQTDKIYRNPHSRIPGYDRARDLTMVLEPGRYILACLHAEEGVSHLSKGMVRELTVIPSREKPTEPVFDATLIMSDYRYAVSGRLTAGKRTIRIVNDGPQEHHVFMQRMRPGATLEDIKTHRAARAKERAAGVPDPRSSLVPPMTPLTAVTRMSRGAQVFLTLELERGNYRLFCLVPDAADGKPHTQHGMDQLITVR